VSEEDGIAWGGETSHRSVYENFRNLSKRILPQILTTILLICWSKGSRENSDQKEAGSSSGKAEGFFAGPSGNVSAEVVDLSEWECFRGVKRGEERG
jgi:hypothetical protein